MMHISSRCSGIEIYLHKISGRLKEIDFLSRNTQALVLRLLSARYASSDR